MSTSINLMTDKRRSVHYSAEIKAGSVTCIPEAGSPGSYIVVIGHGKRRRLAGYIDARVSDVYEVVNLRRLKSAIVKVAAPPTVRA